MVNRRRFLVSLGVLGTLAGCSGVDEEENRKTGKAKTDDTEELSPTKESSPEPDESPTVTPEKKEDDKNIKVLRDTFYDEGEYSWGVRGKAKNVSGEKLDYVEIKVFFYDKEDTRVGESMDNFSDMKEGTEFKFDCSGGFSDAERDEVERYELKVEARAY